MLFNEPKLLKLIDQMTRKTFSARFSALQRAEIAEIQRQRHTASADRAVSVLFNEPKLLKWREYQLTIETKPSVSVLFNEPKLLKLIRPVAVVLSVDGFSALQRAEIAEIDHALCAPHPRAVFQCSSTSRNC